ncbi:MAG: hypothetical protein RL006_1086 [Chloroflexota bacterium]|jgi:TolA-binding protein
MSDPIYEILDHLRKEVQSLRVENDRLRRSRNDEIVAAGDLRKEIERLRARVEVLELIRRYLGQGVSWDRAEEKAIDEIEERKARAALEAKP